MKTSAASIDFWEYKSPGHTPIICLKGPLCKNNMMDSREWMFSLPSLVKTYFSGSGSVTSIDP